MHAAVTGLARRRGIACCITDAKNPSKSRTASTAGSRTAGRNWPGEPGGMCALLSPFGQAQRKPQLDRPSYWFPGGRMLFIAWKQILRDSEPPSRLEQGSGVGAQFFRMLTEIGEQDASFLRPASFSRSFRLAEGSQQFRKMFLDAQIGRGPHFLNRRKCEAQPFGNTFLLRSVYRAGQHPLFASVEEEYRGMVIKECSCPLSTPGCLKSPFRLGRGSQDVGRFDELAWVRYQVRRIWPASASQRNAPVSRRKASRSGLSGWLAIISFHRCPAWRSMKEDIPARCNSLLAS
jgi:hypothetical protein